MPQLTGLAATTQCSSDAAIDWLGGDNAMLETATEKSPPLRAWPVDRRVNNARNQGEELIEPDGAALSD